MFNHYSYDWGELLGLPFFLVGIVLGMFYTGWMIWTIALLFGAAFAKFLLRTGKTRVPALLSPIGFGLGVVLGNLNMWPILPLLVGLYAGIKTHGYLSTLDY
ncbi:MAG: hypothetical protein QF486_04450 [Candidatus Woesearchaeota archaeon]|jgi:hypothetical protein|nr:hypothetical protein [Candidatus Woesearchaeota archaeon]MDP7181751.1 hypothetical protein [Candidatus Woesearchaeota archaeon]MDP7198840.1 hypothetical protein [Candidatus Woesearchaeota archaeon]MDP7467160.1 hypothetical protein [Candidatus Woesearchaeota archaeon]MDP7647505.1 hypothetical protein [Candidatus Woesearchaeota archaeon]|tara:strand:+ start:869 stop:1174 length:306 start_codon:yes stop_codon:yes gene_type:complete